MLSLVWEVGISLGLEWDVVILSWLVILEGSNDSSWVLILFEVYKQFLNSNNISLIHNRILVCYQNWHNIKSNWMETKTESLGGERGEEIT